MAAPKGNKFAVGNKGGGGVAKARPITSAITQKLHEMVKDKSLVHGQNREYLWALVDELFAQAVSRKVKFYDKKKGEHVEVVVPGDLAAIMAIMDRVEGKPMQSHQVEGDGTARVMLIFDPEDAAL